MRLIALLILPLLTATATTALKPLANGSWSRAEDSHVSGLSARCLWAESGWQAIVLGLSQSASSESVAYALDVLTEHARLHGWMAEVGGGTHSLVTEAVKCPPAALAELNRVDRSHLSEPQVLAIESVSRALAENGHVERAVSILDELRGQERLALHVNRSAQIHDRVLWQAARLLEAAGHWQVALDYLEELDATRRWDELSINRVRAHCYYELQLTPKLESLLYANLTSDSSCHSLELLIQAWRRAGSTKGLPQLLEGCLQSVNDASAKQRIEAEITERFETAARHLEVLGLQPTAIVDQLTALLAGGDHHREAQLSLLYTGSQSVDGILERAQALPVDDQQLIHELYAVLAESGLAQVEGTIKAVNEESGFPYLSIWKAAHALRRDLAAH